MIEQKVIEALTHATRIQEVREKTIARRYQLNIVATRVIASGDRMTTHHLVDLSRQLGHGKCCWVPPLPDRAA